MHRKFDIRRYLTAFFVGIFAIVGTVVALEAPARAALGDTSEIDYALALNSGQALSTPDANALDLSANLTIEFWYKVSSTASRMILNKEVAYEFATDENGKFMYAFSSGNRWNWNVTPMVIPTGRWVHVAFTKASTVTKLFFDGIQVWTQTGGVASVDGTTPANPSTLDNQQSYLMIGGRATTPSGIASATTSGDGLTIDELKLWNTERTQANIAASMHEKATSGASGLVAYWNFNEGTTSSSAASNFDRSGNNLHLTFFGTPTSSNGNFVDVKSVARANGQTVVTFPRTYLPGVNGWTVPSNASRARVLVVGGGGAGGSAYDGTGGGGGGAGGFTESVVRLTSGSLQTVKVGQGGIPDLRVDTYRQSSGTTGQTSAFESTEVLGGGGGAARGSLQGLTGASAGGSSGTAAAKAGTPGQGNAGGAGGGSYKAGGGGGGAGSAGSAGSSSTPGNGGAGGTGKTSDINRVAYAAGGAGGSSYVENTSGVGAATANSGNGGAGGNSTTATPAGGGGGSYGGSGVVIVAYASEDDNAFAPANGSDKAVSSAQIFPSDTTQDFTLEVWIKPTSFPANHQPILATPSDNSPYTTRFYLGTTSDNSRGKVFVAVASTTGFSSKNSIGANEWTHVAISIQGTTLYMYLNGILDSTQTGINRAIHPAGIQVGTSSNPNTTRFFNGQIDQVKLWHSALNETAVARSMHSHTSSDSSGQIDSTLQHAYDFNEEISGVYEDFNGSANLTKTGTPVLQNVVTTSSVSRNSIYTFPRTVINAWGGWFSPVETSSASVLVVAGGGGGGGHAWGGGGGAGAMLEATANQTLISNTATRIIVGQGGLGGSELQDSTNKGKDGGNSTFGTAIAIGGGAGGGHGYLGISRAIGSEGGSGGGHSEYNSTLAAKVSNQADVAGFTKRGFAGGAMDRTASQAGSGGGGAGSAGVSVASGAAQGVSGAGGGGFQSSISGSATFYAGGGAGGKSASATASLGGSSIGGNGGSSNVAPTAGAANTGSGGGGTGNVGSYTKLGGAGGSGIVIVSVATGSLPQVNVNFDELNFDYTNVSHIVGTNGMTLGNKVLFLNVTTKEGVQVDALVTTEVISAATIRKYESGASAGGELSYFQTDVDITGNNGFAQFRFDFYQHGVSGSAGDPCTSANPTCSNATKVVLQNVNVSAIDIDANQWNDFTLAESYTLAGNTKLKECVIPSTGTCTRRQAPATFPSDMRFQGDTTARANDPVDMAIVTYAEIETFRIKFGRSVSGNPNYYGVAFKALDWGGSTPQTTGGTEYDIVYNGNGASTGTTGSAHRGPAGTLFSTLGAGTLAKTGHEFSGWSTSSTATTATYTASSNITMPGNNVTLYAVWTAINYTLTYSANGGTGAPAAGSHASGTNNVTLSATRPTRSGYVFGGWNTQADGAGANTYGVPATPTVLTYSMPSANTTLYAKWTVADGTLSYNANGGTTTETSVRAQGGTTTTVAGRTNTSRTGYDFSGWNSKADGTGTSYAAGSTFTLVADVTTTVYARWALSRYNLSFNVNGGVGTPQTQSYVQGATTTLPATNPTRAGYTFDGWNTAANGSGTNYSGSFQMPGNHLSLYAKWTPLTYAVTYDNNSATFSGASGSVTDSTLYESDQTVSVKRSTGLSYSGSPMHRFIGWNTKADGTGTDYLEESTLTMTASAVRLYAMWLDSTVEIAYNANGGANAPANDNATINTRYDIATSSPSRPGYTFNGWTISDGSPAGTYKVGGTTYFSPNSNFEVLVAQWTAVDYNVTYDSDGGSTAPSQLTAKHIGDLILVDANEPTKNGYTFLGWKDAAGNIYPAGGSFTLGAGSVTLTAQWQGTPYTLTYDANGGIGGPSGETRNYNASANLSIIEPTRTGYSFQGWNTLVGGTGTAKSAGASFQMPAANTTLYAQWTVNTYPLAYNSQNGSTAPAGGDKNYNSTIVVSSATMTRTGYSFGGWNTSADGTGTTYLANATFTMPNASVTLYAQWTKTAYTLYYNTNGGQGVYSSQPIKYGESITVDSTLPTRLGYNFIGWNTQAGGGGSDHSARSVYTLNSASNVTLYAKWQAASYSVSYSANGGSGAPSGANYTYDTDVVTAVSGSITRTSYRFVGWNDRDDGSGTTYTEGFTFKMPAQNVILYAQWVDARFQIAYNANGGSGGPDPVEIENVISGTTTYQVERLAPVRPGYTFAGWKLQDGTPTTSTMVNGTGTDYFVMSGDEVLIAQWTIKTIYVTYDLNGGASGSSVAQSYGNFDTSVLLSTATITRNNFQFSGWSTAPDGTGSTYAAGSSFRLPSNNVILYAKWDPVYYVIEYNPAGGTGEPADQFATPSSTVAIATQEPTKTGYEFEKWTEVSQGTDFVPGASLTMPSNNVVLVANYTVRSASVPGAGGGSSTGVIDPGTAPLAKPKQLVLSVFFKGDSPVLTTNTKIALKRLAAIAKAYGRANNITIYGRVKETNDKSYDQRLSQARAANVAAFLKKYGVTGVFKVYAKGISPENTYKSRRVDMKLWWAK